MIHGAAFSYFADAPNFTQPQNRSAHLGETVNFTCDYPLLTTPPEWCINNEYYNHRDFPMEDGREFFNDGSRRTLSVHVTNDTDKMRKYQCRYINQDSRDAEEICSDCAFLHVINGMEHSKFIK